MLGLTLHEICKGPVSPRQRMQLRDEGGSCISIHRCIDAMPIFSALAVDRVKPPAEKFRHCHVLWLKQMIQAGSLTELSWIDTHDMTADGHTKGGIDREAIVQVAHGRLVRSHVPKAMTSKSTSSQRCSASLSATVFFVVTGDATRSQPFLAQCVSEPPLPRASLSPAPTSMSLGTITYDEMSYPNDGNWFGPGRHS